MSKRLRRERQGLCEAQDDGEIGAKMEQIFEKLYKLDATEEKIDKLDNIESKIENVGRNVAEIEKSVAS